MSIKRRSIPNTKTLLVFEAAARRGSFSLAAADLGLTQSAVSHQIKSFENWLGVALFVRTPVRMELTDKGLQLLAGLTPLLDAIQTVLDKATAQPTAPVVRIVTYSTFGSRWLLPELLKISQSSGSPVPELHYTNASVSYDPDASDFAILQGSPPWPGLNAQLLLPERLVVAAAPGFAEPGLCVAALARLPYLSIHSRPISFGLWSHGCGVESAEPAPTQTFQTYEQMIVACATGYGFGVFPDILIHKELEAGTLVTLSDTHVDAGCAYYILHPKERPLNDAAKQFAAALLQGAKLTKAPDYV